MGAHEPREHLGYTFAAWVFDLHVAGISASDSAVSEACAGIAAAEDATAGEAAGQALVTAINAVLGDGTPGEVLAAAKTLFGDRVSDSLGEGDRESRTHRIRRNQFDTQLPWLALIYQRTDDRVGPAWLLIERFTDHVTAADPNPWDDVDDEQVIPVADFQVLWELSGCTSVHLGPA